MAHRQHTMIRHRRAGIPIGLVLSTLGVSVIVAAAPRAVGTTSGQNPDVPITLSAHAVNIGNSGRVGADRIEFHLDRWSSDAERDALVRALDEKGPQSMVAALQRTGRVGFLRVSSSLGYDLRYARLAPGADGGATMVILTDRPIDWWETRQWRPIRDYPFTHIELHLDAQGSGEGTMSIATRIKYDAAAGTMTLDAFESQPVRLQNVRV
jgi:hypothetical protein